MPLKQNQQNILLAMVANGHRTTFFNQEIYKSFRMFQREMQLLKNADLVNMKSIKSDGKYIVEYSLSVDGVVFGKLLKLVNDKLII